jgi:hypothetical protein
VEQLGAGSGAEGVEAGSESALKFFGAHEANASTRDGSSSSADGSTHKER